MSVHPLTGLSDLLVIRGRSSKDLVWFTYTCHWWRVPRYSLVRRPVSVSVCRVAPVIPDSQDQGASASFSQGTYRLGACPLRTLRASLYCKDAIYPSLGGGRPAAITSTPTYDRSSCWLGSSQPRCKRARIEGATRPTGHCPRRMIFTI